MKCSKRRCSVYCQNTNKLQTKDIRRKGIEVKIDIRDEPWGDRHFAIEDPNGVGVDIVTYSSQ